MIDFTRLAFEAALRGGLQPSVELLTATWDILVGDDASRHTRPESIQDGIITVAVRRDWMTEWTRHQDILLINITRYIPGIRTLHFVEGEFEPSPTQREPSQVIVETDELDAEQLLEETLSRIDKLRSAKGDA